METRVPIREREKKFPQLSGASCTLIAGNGELKEEPLSLGSRR